MGSNFSKNSEMLRCRIIGAEQIHVRFRLVGEACRERIKEAAFAQAKSVRKEARALSRAQLQRRTGKTHRAFRIRRIDKGDNVGAVIAIRWYVARFWERGFGGGKSFRIKEHCRKPSARSPRPVKVRGHARVIDQTARPALMPAFNAARSEIRAALEQALKGAARGA